MRSGVSGRSRTRAPSALHTALPIAAAVGPLLGGFLTTFLSWRIAFLLEALVIGVVLLGIGLVRDVPFTGERKIDPVVLRRPAC